jgi:hypothetical protein
MDVHHQLIMVSELAGFPGGSYGWLMSAEAGL